MANIDLNAAKAARAEVEKEPKTVTIGDKTLELPNEIPFAFTYHLERNEATAATMALLNGSFEAFMETDPTDNDVLELWAEAAKLYGLEGLGELSASDAPSKKTTKRSRPTSKPPTA